MRWCGISRCRVVFFFHVTGPRREVQLFIELFLRLFTRGVIRCELMATSC